MKISSSGRVVKLGMRGEQIFKCVRIEHEFKKRVISRIRYEFTPDPFR